MGKRGRKPSLEKKNGVYWGENEEEAVLRYISSDSADERNYIYTTILRKAFEKMIESIIRRYKLFVPEEDYIDTFNDTASFLHTKLEKFEPGKHKAYSYYGTICKHYLIGRIGNYNKKLQRNPSYDTAVDEYINNIKYSDVEDNSTAIANETIEKLVIRISNMLENRSDYSLRDNEYKLGNALKNLLENWEFVLSTEKSKKFNKNAILLFLREETGLDTKGIRDNLKKFKKEFLIIKDAVIN